MRKKRYAIIALIVCILNKDECTTKHGFVVGFDIIKRKGFEA